MGNNSYQAGNFADAEAKFKTVKTVLLVGLVLGIVLGCCFGGVYGTSILGVLGSLD
jgi:hypothetical protein